MIIDAITFALYGKSSGSGRDDFESLRCTKADDSVDTFVRFEFENAGEIYAFERRLEHKRKNFSKSYDVSKKDDDGDWEDVCSTEVEELTESELIRDYSEEEIWNICDYDK